MNFNTISQQNIRIDTKLGEDMISNTSKSMCISEKTTVENERNLRNVANSPFV